MIDINKVNIRLNYTEFYNMSEYNWNTVAFYNTKKNERISKKL